jgi:two-component system sensor histidine kinase TctE
LAREGPDSRAHLEQARVAAARLARLAQQVLSLAAADPISNPAGGDAPCDLAEVVRANAAAWLRASPKADIEFALEPAPVRGDAVLLGEAAANLVDNAARYGGHAIIVSTGVRDGQAILQVEDDGPGIPPADRDRVLERFQRGVHADLEGSGLGLAIVKEIAQRHGGSVAISEATSRVNGARVTVSLPLHA